jgi:hypothetical protein
VWPATAVLLIFAAFAIWVFIRTPSSYYLRLALIPGGLLTAILFGWYMWLSYGFAVPEELPEVYDFLGYHVVIKDNRKTAIEVWVEGRRSRLYVIPYSKQAEQALKEASAKKRTGAVIRMQKKAGRGGDSKGGANDYPYESNLMLPQDFNPKNGM